MAEEAVPGAPVLTGGAARGAYEVGVLEHVVTEVAKGLGHEVIFDIRCGTTVGALNISCLAAYADEPRSRVAWLDHVWSSPEVGSSSCLAAPLPRPRLYLMRSRGVGPGRRYDKGDC